MLLERALNCALNCVNCATVRGLNMRFDNARKRTNLPGQVRTLLVFQAVVLLEVCRLAPLITVYHNGRQKLFVRGNVTSVQRPEFNLRKFQTLVSKRFPAPDSLS